MREEETITVIATFHPQAWINDYAVEIDGSREFEITLTVEKAREILEEGNGDDSYETDHLWSTSPLCLEEGHTGPFWIEVCEAIEDALEEKEETLL